VGGRGKNLVLAAHRSALVIAKERKRRSNPERRLRLDCFAALAVTHGIAFSRRIAAPEPWQATVSDSSPPDIAVRRTASFGRLCRWSMLSCSRKMPVEAFARVASAWIAGSSPAMTKRNEREERKKKSEAKRRQTQGSSAVPYGHGRASQRGGAHLSAFHRGSRPKESFIARDSAPGFCFLGRGRTGFAYPFERALPARCLSQSSEAIAAWS